MTEKTYYTDPQGEKVLAKYVPAYDRKRDRIARRIYARWMKAQELLRQVKTETLRDIEHMMIEAQNAAGVSLGGVKGNVQFRSFDGNITVSLDQQAKTEFDERLALAQNLIMEAVREMTDGVNADLAEIAIKAFQPRKSGRLDMQRIRDLRNYKVKNAKWVQACKIIGECERKIGSLQYVRVTVRRNKDTKPEPVRLDIASIDVENGGDE